MEVVLASPYFYFHQPALMGYIHYIKYDIHYNSNGRIIVVLKLRPGD